jgi:hypothetical protein
VIGITRLYKLGKIARFRIRMVVQSNLPHEAEVMKSNSYLLFHLTCGHVKKKKKQKKKIRPKDIPLKSFFFFFFFAFIFSLCNSIIVSKHLGYPSQAIQLKLMLDLTLLYDFAYRQQFRNSPRIYGKQPSAVNISISSLFGSF